MNRGDLATATAEHKRLEPLVRAVMTHVPGTVAAKYILHGLGRISSPRVRLPLVGPEEWEAALIEDELDLVQRRRRRRLLQLPPRPQRGRGWRPAEGARHDALTPTREARHEERTDAYERPTEETPCPSRIAEPAALDEGTLRVTPLGGLGEIGRNMTIFEFDGKILIVDCGVLFPEEHQPGVDLILPDFEPIKDRLDDIVGVVLTHGHEDHIGAVPYLLRLKSDIPLIGSGLTLALVEAKLKEHRIKAFTLTVKEGQERAGRTLRPRVRRGEPLDPRCSRRRDPHARRHGARDR